mgnify:CR=1 FL=1
MPKRSVPTSLSEAATAGGSVASRLAATINKDAKDDIAAVAGEAALPADIKGYVSTQCANLDYILCRPGVPIGRLTLLFGKEGSAKSTLCLHLLMEAQRQGGLGVLIDSECRFSRDRAERMGLDADELIVISGATMEKSFAAIETVVKASQEDFPERLVVIAYDSLAGSPTEGLLKKELGEAGSFGNASRFVGEALRRILPRVARSNVALVIVNQLRLHIDASSGPRSYDRRKVMGKYAMLAEAPLIFHSSLGVFLTSAGLYPDNDNPEGIEVRAQVKKHSDGPGEGKGCAFQVSFLRGIDQTDAKFRLLEELGVITRSGAWYSVEGREKKFQRKDVQEVLMETPELEEIIQAAPLAWLEG